MNNRTRLPFRALLASALIITIAGCSAINPLVEPKMQRPDISWKVDGTADHYTPERDTTNPGIYKPATVTVPQARLYARSLQDAYRAAASGQIKSRVLTDAAMMGTAAAAIALAATGGGAQTAGLLGLGAGAVGLGSDRFLIATRKRIWLQGALALECIINAANKLPGGDLKQINLNTSLDALQTRNSQLEATINAQKNQGIDLLRNDELTRRYIEAINEAGTVLADGNAFFNTVNASKGEISHLGQILLSKILEIRLHVESEIVKTEPDLLKYDQAIKNLLANTQSGFLSSNALKNLGQVPESGKPSTFIMPQTFESLSRKEITPSDVKIKQFTENLKADTENSRNARAAATNALTEAVTASALVNGQSLFGDCALSENIGSGQLMVNPSEKLDLKTGIEYSIEAIVSGGKPPYKVDTNVSLPKGITTTIEASANRLNVNVSKDDQTEGSHIVVPIRDSQSAVTNFVIKFKPAEKK